jgi:hypothetical protein
MTRSISSRRRSRLPTRKDLALIAFLSVLGGAALTIAGALLLARL